MTLRISSTALAAVLALWAVGPANATYKLDGDATSLTLVADSASRRELVDAIVAKFGLVTVGGTIEDSMISGRFTGTLGHILKSILPNNGYAIAYSNGRPVRVTFTGQATGEMGDPMLGAPPPVATAIEEAAPGPGGAEQQGQQPMMAAPAQPSDEALPPEAGPPDQQGDPDRQIAEDTARALEQLKALTNDLKATSN